MSFWSDSSPLTKGAIVLGPILIIVALLYNFNVFGAPEVAPQRGITAPAAP